MIEAVPSGLGSTTSLNQTSFPFRLCAAFALAWWVRNNKKQRRPNKNGPTLERNVYEGNPDQLTYLRVSQSSPFVPPKHDVPIPYTELIQAPVIISCTKSRIELEGFRGTCLHDCFGQIREMHLSLSWQAAQATVQHAQGTLAFRARVPRVTCEHLRTCDAWKSSTAAFFAHGSHSRPHAAGSFSAGAALRRGEGRAQNTQEHSQHWEGC